MSRYLPSIAGTKRALTNKVLREIFDHWSEIEEGTGKTRGQMTLSYLYKAEPGNYARLIASLLPKDITIENATSEMDDTQLDDVIARIQERLIDARATNARPTNEPEVRQIGAPQSLVAEGQDKVAVPVRLRNGKSNPRR